MDAINPTLELLRQLRLLLYLTLELELYTPLAIYSGCCPFVIQKNTHPNYISTDNLMLMSSHHSLGTLPPGIKDFTSLDT
jgi:hypothetical protein